MPDYLFIPQPSTKDLSLSEKTIKRVIDYVNSSSIDPAKEPIVRLFISSYRNLCATNPEIIDTVPLTKILMLLNNAVINEHYINGSECALVYSFKNLTIKQNLRYLTSKYIDERGLILIKEAFTKRAIEHIIEKNISMPKQMSELPADIATEKIDINNLHGILIVFQRQDNGNIERSRYYTVDALCDIARKKIVEGKVCDANNKNSFGPWATDPIEMFKKTALKNIMKDAVFI